MLAMVALPAAAVADWPAYGGDSARSMVAAHGPKTPLAMQWMYTPSQPPRPAWPEPGKEQHRLDFDYAPQPVIAHDMVFFGSTADDTLRALDLETGEIKWQFTTGGPIRFAAAVHDGKVYLVSDDGYLYVLDAVSGDLQWSFRGAPEGDHILGNGRMISRWPIRSGVLVDRGQVFFAAGMWPAEGLYVYALDADTGDIVWCNSSSGEMYLNQPHGGASAFTGVCPQGHLLANEKLLIVPSGRTTPAAYDRETGELVYYQPYLYQVPYGPVGWENRGNGGHWSLLAGDYLVTPYHPGGGPDCDSHVGEAGPQSGDGLQIYDAASGLPVTALAGRHRALVENDTFYAVGNGRLQAMNLDQWIDSGKAGDAVTWAVEQSRTYAIIKAENALFLGQQDGVTAVDAETGQTVWRAEVNGQVRALAASAESLIGATDRGTVCCFHSQDGYSVPPPLERTDALRVDAPAAGEEIRVARDILDQLEQRAGYALVAGAADARIADLLSSLSDLHVICLLDDDHAARAERDRLLSTGAYGKRTAVLNAGQDAPLGSYFADVVIIRGEPDNEEIKEAYRLLRPCGGEMLLPDIDPAKWCEIISTAGIPESEQASNGTIVRGALPESADWRYQWADAGRTCIGQDQRVRPPFDMLWFGGPGPDRMLSRHLGGSPPLFVDGRTFITGPHHVIAFNAYNGRELWVRELDDANRRRATVISGNTVADDDSLYVVALDRCYRLDQKTGAILAVYDLPGPVDGVMVADTKKPPVRVNWPREWNVIGPLPRNMIEIDSEKLQSIPDAWTIDGKTYEVQSYQTVDNMIDFTYLYGGFGFPPLKPGEEPAPYPRMDGDLEVDTEAEDNVAYVFAELDCENDGKLAIGAAADWWMRFYLDGRPITDVLNGGKNEVMKQNVFMVDVEAGKHVLAVMVQSGSAGWCLKTVGGAAYEAFFSTLLPRTGMEWAFISVVDDRVLGTAVESGLKGIDYRSDRFFALDRDTGESVWTYRTDWRILGHPIACGDGRAYFMETSLTNSIQHKVMMTDAKPKHRLVALDLSTGSIAWTQDDVPDFGYHAYFQLEIADVKLADGIVVIQQGQAAYDAASGEKIWAQNEPPVARGNRVIKDEWILGQMGATHLQSGEDRTAKHLLTGEEIPWQFARAYGCGPIAGAAHMLFFRSGTMGFFDLERDGLMTYGGIRPGCSVTMIAAGGLMVAPEGSSGCTCSYNFQTSVGLIPSLAREDDWCVFYGTPPTRPVQRMYLNFGAPGDRRDAEGRVWLGYPRPMVDAACPAPVSFLTHPTPWRKSRGPTRSPVRDDSMRWISHSGVEGAGRVYVQLGGSQPVYIPHGNAPTIDGRLDESIWSKVSPLPFLSGSHLMAPETDLRLARDENHIYAGYRKKAVTAEGKRLPFKAECTGDDDENAGYDDHVGLMFANSSQTSRVGFALSCAGGNFDYRMNGPWDMDFKWNAGWQYAVHRADDHWTAEMAIPLRAIEDAGIDLNDLQVNAISQETSGKGCGEIYLVKPNASSFYRSVQFLPVTDCAPEPEPGMYILRLHMRSAHADSGSATVRVQGSGDIHDTSVEMDAKTCVHEIHGIRVDDGLTLEIVPSSGFAPVLCGLEVVREE